MKHVIRVIVPEMLVVTVLISSGCGSSSQSAIATKIVQIAVTDVACVAEALYDGGTIFDKNAAGLEKAVAAFSIL